MPTTITEEVVAKFRADTTNLVDGTARAIKKVNEFKKEVSSTKGNLLNPFSAISEKLTGMSAKLGISGKAVGALAAGGAAFAKVLSMASDLAGQNADRFQSISENMRQASRVNIFASSVDGLNSLVAKFHATQSLLSESKTAQREADPYGFGGGFSGNMLTAVGNMQMGVKNAVGLGPYSNFDREQQERAILKLSTQLAQQQVFKLRQQIGQEQLNQTNLTDARLTGSGFDARSAELVRGRKLELLGLKADNLDAPDNRLAIRRRYKAERAAAREQQESGDTRFLRDSGISGIEGSLVSNEQKRARIANVNLAFIRQELRERTYLTAEARQTLQVDELRAQNELRAANLANRQHEDNIGAMRLSIENQREIVSIGQRGFEAKKQQADLDVQAAQAAVEQAHGAREYTLANERLKDAVAARVRLERVSVATQRASADIAFRLASHTADVNGSNRSDISKRAQINRSRVAAMRAELFLPGTTDERGRELLLGIRGGENDRRETLQERAFGKSPASVLRSLQRERNETRLRDIFDSRMRQNDGLINLQRDINGNITSGADILTGERRAPRRDSRGNIMAAVDRGHDTDTAKGHTALAAARATVDALDISNAYLKNISEQIGNLGLN